MAPSPTVRRLLKETQELSPVAKHPNPTFHAAPVSEDNLHEWHFTLLGPPSPSPYAGGIYHGRITLPPAYPMKPPNFRFLTPSGRFEVNREICLSISGFHEETWQPAWGVRLALTALRGFMGEEGTAGQVGGLESPKEVRERLARESRSWRCQGCGGSEEDGDRKGCTNEERIKWWWELCRAKGVNVEAEVEGLENLPDGVKLEARQVNKGKQKEDPSEEREANLQSRNPSLLHNLTTNDISPSAQLQHFPLSTPTPPKPPLAASTLPSSSSISEKNHTTTTTSTHTNTSHNTRIPSTSNTTAPTANLRPILQIPTTRPAHPRQTDSPITIDRAIAAIFLALCIMILKKVFYPNGFGALFGGYDELRMVRE